MTIELVLVSLLAGVVGSPQQTRELQTDVQLAVMNERHVVCEISVKHVGCGRQVDGVLKIVEDVVRQPVGEIFRFKVLINPRVDLVDRVAKRADLRLMLLGLFVERRHRSADPDRRVWR